MYGVSVCISFFFYRHDIGQTIHQLQTHAGLSLPDLRGNWTINHWTLSLNTDRKTKLTEILKLDKMSV